MYNSKNGSKLAFLVWSRLLHCAVIIAVMYEPKLYMMTQWKCYRKYEDRTVLINK